MNNTVEYQAENEAIKADVGAFVRACEVYGLAPRQRGARIIAQCPACHEHELWAFVTQRGAVYWTCYKCHACGDVFALAGYVLGLDSKADFAAIKKSILTEGVAGTPTPPTRRPEGRRTPTPTRPPDEGRRASLDAIARARRNPAELVAALERDGLPVVFADECPLLGLTPHARVCYGYRNGVKVRAHDGATERATLTRGGGIRWTEVAGERRFSWAAGGPAGDVWRVTGRPGGDVIFITEGESDALALAWLYRGRQGTGTPSVIFALPSASSRVTLPADFVAGKRALVIGDNDEAGRASASWLADMLAAQGLAVGRWYPPAERYKDVRALIQGNAERAADELAAAVADIANTDMTNTNVSN